MSTARSTAASVVAVLVSHDGAAWLPAVIDGIRAQQRPVDDVLVVDTGSKDASVDLLEQAWPSRVVRTRRDASWPEAIDVALEELRARREEPEWLWLLHDDANPHPTALASLLAAAEEHPDADILGPKLREWPSLRRLLELGVTISGTGRRETDLERGEYDQGQHEEVREVLAVNTAGMLIRREVLLELGGFDDQLPIFGNDIDLGWRAAAAGHTTMAVPDAIVFHAEAAHRGIRQTPLTGRHTHFQERRAALHTLLVNSSTAQLPWRAVRLVFGSVLRMVGFLLVRSPGEALDELAALLAVYGRPGQIMAGRRRRRRSAGTAGVDRERVGRLLAPWWLPYRHGLDFAEEVVAAASQQAADVAERRRLAAAEADPDKFIPPRSDRDEEFEDPGLLVRWVTDPIALLVLGAGLLYLVGAREFFAGASGAALSAAPAAASDWWRLHIEASHAVGLGSNVPAPPYVLPLALLGSIVGPSAAVTLLFLGSIPLAAWGAWRFLRVATRLLGRNSAPPLVLAWGAGTYALLPVASGGWHDGRLGFVTAAALLPWFAHAALSFADPDPERRQRAGWRCGLLLALTTAFAPVLWWCAVAVVAAALAAASYLARRPLTTRTVWQPPLTALAVPVVLLLPWWLPALATGAGGGLFLDTGAVVAGIDGMDLLAGRFADLGAPAWVGLLLPLLAVAALAWPTTRIPVLVCWLVAAVVAVVALVLGRGSIDLAGGLVAQPGLGVPLLLLHGCWTTAVVIALHGMIASTPDRAARAVTATVAVVALTVPVVGMAWFATGTGSASETEAGEIPVYMRERAAATESNAVLVVAGSVADGLRYRVHRGAGLTIGRDEIAAFAAEDERFSAVVTEMVTAPSREAMRDLADYGIGYVVLPAPVDGDVAARIDATGGVRRASAEDRATRAWSVLHDRSEVDSLGERAAWRTLLVLGQLAAILVVIVFCLPTMRRRRR